MALVLVKEDGSGRADANSYADIADGDAYFDGHLYNAAWELSAVDRKAAALAMATRVIDAEFRFDGWKASSTQALQWPRIGCPSPDRGQWRLSVLLFGNSDYIESNTVPVAVVQATCEMARELMLVDRTAAPPGEGLYRITSGSGATFVATTYNKVDTRKVLSEMTRKLLGRYGSAIGSGMVKLTRA